MHDTPQLYEEEEEAGSALRPERARHIAYTHRGKLCRLTGFPGQVRRAGGWVDLLRAKIEESGGTDFALTEPLDCV